MLQIQPLDSEPFKDINISDIKINERKIKEQRMGHMFDRPRSVKITINDRLRWLKRDIRGLFYDVKYTIRNYFKWARTIAKLRPWNGFDGLLVVAQKHLEDYITHEEKFGNSEESYRQNKINTAKETAQILKRLEDTIEYPSRRLDLIYAKYPKYLSMISEFNNSISFSGKFVQQDDNLWVGEESGTNPRRGCFHLIDNKFELTESPNLEETNRLLKELDNFNEEVSQAYKLAQQDIQDDFHRFSILFSENLHKWWD